MNVVRAAFIAYLTLATVLGPNLCCCNMQQLLSLTHGSSACCGKNSSSAAAADHQHHLAGHTHNHGSSHADSRTPAHESQQAPCDHGSRDCPCGQHHAKLVATPPSEGVQVRNSDSPDHIFCAVAIGVLFSAEFDGRDASAIAHANPASLYGREMLRAYQTLRC